MDAFVEGLLPPRLPTALGSAGRPGGGPILDPAVRSAAELLRRRLVRFHPSFRFEEELAEQLRLAADPSGERGVVVPFARRNVPEWVDLPSAVGGVEIGQGVEVGRSVEIGQGIGVGRVAEVIDRRMEDLPDLPRAVERIPRPVLMGGAIASGVSLAGVALVAWHLGHRGAPGPACSQPGER